METCKLGCYRFGDYKILEILVYPAELARVRECTLDHTLRLKA